LYKESAIGLWSTIIFCLCRNVLIPILHEIQIRLYHTSEKLLTVRDVEHRSQ